MPDVSELTTDRAHGVITVTSETLQPQWNSGWQL
jgi:hypothetical protein